MRHLRLVFGLPLFLQLHKFWGFRRIGRIYEFGHDEREFLESDWLRDVGIEASLDALCVDIAENVGGKSNDRVPAVPVFLLPTSDLFAGLIAIFVRHVEIALQDSQFESSRKCGFAYQNDRIVAWRLRKNCVCALNTVKDRVSCHIDLGEELEYDLCVR
jgi:hypothetical protein